MLQLRYATPDLWTRAVMADFDRFLNDHASAENKAAGMAMSMVLHYRDKPDVVKTMLDLAIEEMSHFRDVVRLLHSRNMQLLPDERDEYVRALRAQVRTGKRDYFLDRLLLGAIIEARGVERFGLVATSLPKGELKAFYSRITASEARHYQLFLDLAHNYFPSPQVNERLDQLLDVEATITARLPYLPRLH